jgi:NADPH-dependent 2,4-dienoyl-CoA reductase/sulfur reductase-like enzyme
MPYYISGVTADHRDLIARTPEEFREKNEVDVLTGHRVIEIDAGNRTVLVRDLESGREFRDEYTVLLLSTGASAFVPPVAGVDLEGCFVLRQLSDSISIKSFIRDRAPRRAVIVGAGPVGMEMCESFRRLGLAVTVVDTAVAPMPYMDPELSSRVLEKLESEGVECRLGEGLEGMEADRNGTLRRIETTEGSLDCDIALLAIGIRPATELARSAGVELGAREAVKVDEGMHTNIEGVYAAGDCAVTFDAITGSETWIPLGSTSRKQARAAADSMFGAPVDFPGVVGTSIVKCFDLTVGRTGLDEAYARESGFEPVSVSFEARDTPEYYPSGGGMALKIICDSPSGRVLGAQVVGGLASGADKRLDVFAVCTAAGMTTSDLEHLDLAYAPPYSAAVDAPIMAGNLMSGKLTGKPCRCDSSGLE